MKARHKRKRRQARLERRARDAEFSTFIDQRGLDGMPEALQRFYGMISLEEKIRGDRSRGSLWRRQAKAPLGQRSDGKGGREWKKRLARRAARWVDVNEWLKARLPQRAVSMAAYENSPILALLRKHTFVEVR